MMLPLMQNNVTVPTGFLAVRSFYILQSSVKYPLEYITPANMNEIRGGSRTGRPVCLYNRE